MCYFQRLAQSIFLALSRENWFRINLERLDICNTYSLIHAFIHLFNIYQVPIEDKMHQKVELQ